MITNAMNSLKASVQHIVWILSDLQQSDPVKSRACLTEALRDFEQLQLDCEQMWYLGDAIEGGTMNLVQEMVDMHLELLQPLGIPLRYVLGNHDFDVLRSNQDVQLSDIVPFHTQIQTVPGWRTTSDLQSFYFVEELGNYLIVFLSDHCSRDQEWHTTNGEVHGNKSAYPYNEDDYRAVTDIIKSSGKPTIIAGHYAFAGGNRPSDLYNQMLPLPSQVRVHFHGHAHIGDSVWAGKDCYRKIGFTENQPIPQINVSSLENARGNHIRSVILEIYDDDSMGIYFRDHDRGEWAEMYLITPN